MKGYSQCPIFLLRFMNISKDERNKALGSTRWKSSIISQEVQTLNLLHTHVKVHKPCTGTDTHRIFNFQSDPVQQTLLVRLYCPLYLASKFHPAIKAKFSMTQWRLRCRKCNQQKPPQVLMNYRERQ